MNEMLKVAIESRDSLAKYLKEIEEVFDNGIPGKDAEEVSGHYAGMYGAIEECLSYQNLVIDALGIECADGRTVGEVFDDILEWNTHMDNHASKFEKANNLLERYVKDMADVFVKGP